MPLKRGGQDLDFFGILDGDLAAEIALDRHPQADGDVDQEERLEEPDELFHSRNFSRTTTRKLTRDSGMSHFQTSLISSSNR